MNHAEGQTASAFFNTLLGPLDGEDLRRFIAPVRKASTIRQAIIGYPVHDRIIENMS
jgi:hypothetical protein